MQPLFTFKDVSSKALENWLNNFDIWSRATWIAVETIFQPHLVPESRLIQIAVALEALGYAIWKYEENSGDVSSCGKAWCKGRRKKNDPCTKPGCNIPKAADYFRKVAEKIPFAQLEISDEGTAQEWANAFNKIYKGCKHADNELPDSLDANNRSQEGLMVIRFWLAKQLNVVDEVLIDNRKLL